VRFKLLVMPDGHAILTTEERVTAALADEIHRAFQQWREGAPDVFILGATEVVMVQDLELEIDEEEGREQP
jgi:hypothetical protein